ncbi:MAG TPA: site-specific integrase [Solirubrobacteraceae bacterium]|jgi:integrase
MSVQADRERWVVRWRDGSGRQRGRRFESEASARAFDAGLREVAPRERRADGGQRAGGVYPYPTKRGTRWYFKVRDSSSRQTTRRGFTSEKAARDAKRRLVEQVERGEVRHTRESFGEHWQRWLARRKPYLEPGTWRAYEIDGRKRLLPTFESIPLGRLGVEQVRAWMEEQAEAVDAGEIAPKTVNNTLGTLVVCLNAAAEDGLLAANPALRVPRLPPAHIERDYLRLHEIPLYLDSCSALYRPVAELLIGSGLRISEALALKVSDLELEAKGGVIVVYRSRKKDSVGSTKSDRFRSVEIGQGLAGVLRDHLACRAEMASGDQAGAHVFVMPARTRKRDQGRWEGEGDGQPMDRTTVSRDWHKAALQDASLRDMPLHALRHTAAAAWLAGANSLMYVQRQLGHADIGTTERYYGHLERHVLAAGAVATEEAIARAAREQNA